MRITLIIGIPNPGSVDAHAVAKELPYGEVNVNVVEGGLEVPNEDGNDALIIANAAVLVCFDE